MRIYSMTATFGKLEHQTLTLQPGLNIIEAPNEWGKSTWCAFLVNMLYGIDTRVRSTGSALAEKEKYAPWSGSPMAGRIELNWNGQDITIERRTKGRIPFGDFKAYETATGIEVPQLTSANCGQTLLGVERSVFTRAGFLKLSDLPVTQDDSLRRRLNNLVTTGDENDAGDQLGKTLKDLKNKCRHNRTGLLPQAENDREQLKEQLRSLYSLNDKADSLTAQQAQLEKEIALLKNHRDALQYQASIQGAQQVGAAVAARDQLKEQVAALEAQCAQFPSSAEAAQALTQAQTLQEQWMALQAQQQQLPPSPMAPNVPARLEGRDPEVAVKEANDHYSRYTVALSGQKKQAKQTLLSLMLGIGLLAICIALSFVLTDLSLYLYATGGGITLIAILLFVLAACRSGKFRKEAEALQQIYPGILPDSWVSDTQTHADAICRYQQQLQHYNQLSSGILQQQTTLQDAIQAFTGGNSLADCQRSWTQIHQQQTALEELRRDLAKAQAHAETLQSVIKDVPPPQHPDPLTASAEETDARLNQARFEQRQLHLQLGKVQGQVESLGQESLLKARLDTLNRKIARLEDTYYALELAQDSLYQATLVLQRRFAPRISKRAQELFQKLTEGRYPRITLGEDLSLSASAENEDTLRAAQWRSDGTVDQLYLALRLAVAEALTPDAPLILDDALVRFDDRRLAAALRLLSEESESKQVLLFTCQSREKAALSLL